MKKHIRITLEVDGETVARDFAAHQVHHIDWNPHINDMADTIANLNQKHVNQNNHQEGQSEEPSLEKLRR